METATVPLFVYGTLKRGQSNHSRLRGATWLGRVCLEGACLYDLGPFPMAVPGEGTVQGELYAVSREALPLLDAFEGCPRLYERQWLALADGRRAWVYLGRARQVRYSPRLPRGTWPAEAEPLGVLPSRRPRPWRWLWALALVGGLRLGGAQAGGFDSLGACQAWRQSHGAARRALANAIGAAHYLTKRHPFAESPPEAPVELYDAQDIARVCGRS